jgi:hypothetical protein
MTRIRSKKLLIGCFVGILLCGTAFVLWLSVPQPTASFPISFLGLTNNAANPVLATFRITNQTRWTISYYICPAQFRSNGVWSPVPAPKGAGNYLPAHQASTFTVPVPSHGEAWRVPVFWGCVPTGSAYYRGLVNSNLRLNWYLIRRGRSPKFSRGAEFEIYTSYSPDIAR